MTSWLHFFLNVLHFSFEGVHVLASQLRRIVNRELPLQIGKFDRFDWNAGQPGLAADQLREEDLLLLLLELELDLG